MGLFSWLFGIGLPTLSGAALIAAAAYAWFRVPWFGREIGLGLAVIGVGLIAYGQGYASARSDCQDASLRAELAQVKADLSNARAAADQARVIGDRLNQSEARNMELAHELATRPEPDACRNATDDDAQRLRSIR